MPTPKRLRVSEDDPLTRAIAPPSYESPAEREERLAAEQEAKRVSDAIDEELNKQRISEKKGPKAIKILLLGQSESGKSTTLKNFQLMNSPKAFRSERASWRAVIQLNVVQSIHAILDLMSRAHSSAHIPSTPINHITNPSSTPTPSKEYPPLNSEHLKLKMRLAPLLQVEAALMKKLIPNGHAQFSNPAQSLPIQQEISVNSSAGWKNTFNRLMGRNSCDSADLIDWADPDDPGVVLNACAEDMKRLWTDPIVRKLMEVEKMRPEEMAGFFLDALDRVTSPRYIPTDDDVLRARLKTLGVSEHRFTMKTGHMGSPMSHDWRVFDVGGQRSLRAAWVPYFDDMNAIIFLAPISCFDQVLQEDPSVNRLADSFLLWKSIVSNPLLKKTELILFLNKCDILRAKLASGIRLADYIVSYGSRPNDFESASQYLKKKFAGLLKEHSPERLYYFHLTSVTDTKSTTYILENVQDVLVRDNLRRSALVT
ncbi:guanine nucleotide binding protein, alpha subunit [Suillus subalutaceus]|uniref:guanine nucleotide binding protein, alpha subunit n=1 Tax=Suillus subalutaceus TaxID=48586 RepID=UPI001B864923|nr:guanine nucleotide binding protein, alpha subunit [Suillus subalutaceus]KAG1840836.1 guanine nucleotide binding protein, alpha subunit [Suillus subalutaceus]